MTDKLRELLEDVQTVYEGKGMVVHPNSFDKLRMEVIKLDNINVQQSEQFTKAKDIIREFVEWANWQGNSKCPSFKSIQDKAEKFIKDNEEEDHETTML